MGETGGTRRVRKKGGGGGEAEGNVEELRWGMEEGDLEQDKGGGNTGRGSEQTVGGGQEDELEEVGERETGWGEGEVR